jgi:hypothetical protein
MSNKIVKNFYVDGSMLERIEKYGLTFSSFARRSLEWTIADLESGRRSFDPIVQRRKRPATIRV